MSEEQRLRRGKRCRGGREMKSESKVGCLELELLRMVSVSARNGSSLCVSGC